MQELREIDGDFEVWATGYVASCDYAGIIFAYGYYTLAGLITSAILILLLGSVWNEGRKGLKDFFKVVLCFEFV